MPGVIPNYRQGPTSWPVWGYQGQGTPTTITGGQVVVANTAAGSPSGPIGFAVLPAGANAVNCLGVAAHDAAAPRTSQDGSNPAVISQQPDILAVYYGVDIDVTYAANAAAGQLLVAAANGQVTPFTEQGAGYVQAAGDAAMLIGRCSQPSGVVIGTNVVGSMRYLT